MMRAANPQLPDDVPTRAAGRPAGGGAQPNADLRVAAGCGRGAFAAGALAVSQLQDINANVPFEPGELSEPLSAAEADWGPRGRALLMRAALHEVPTARAEVLQKAFQLGRDKGGLPIVVGAVGAAAGADQAGGRS